MLSELAYKRKGSGEPLVLIHGIGHRKEAFDPVFEQLAEHFDVIAVDQPGFGDSPGFPKGTGYTLKNVIQCFEENFAAWGVKKPHVVGNSLGGAIALELGSRRLVRSVTGLSPAGFYNFLNLIPAGIALIPLKVGSYAPDFVLKNLSKTKFGRFAIGMTLYAYPNRYDSDRVYGDAVAMRDGKAFWPHFARMVFYRFTGAITVPTTIAWGARDILLPPQQGRKAQRKLTLAQHVPIHDAGHVPMGDQPDHIVAIITETVSRVSPDHPETVTTEPAPVEHRVSVA